MIRSRLSGVCRAVLCTLMFITGGVAASAALPSLSSPRESMRPRPESLEARLSWGVDASRAGKAHRLGATGAGVVVAMIDTGVAPSSAALFGNLSGNSIDLIPNRRADTGNRQHGEQTASLLAARLDGTGTFGIAYDATLLSIRADRDGSCLKVCAFDPEVLARAIDYAIEHGARVIGLPVASKQPLPVIERALQRAVANGVVVVAAAGNNGADEPVWPARYAADPRFAASMLVTGATTFRGKLAAWSNRAGVARARFVGAPGDQVIVDCKDRRCYLASGTSYSVSYAAGALALLLSRDPTLSGPEAAAMLLRSADDLGDRGEDPLTGRGRLNVSRALRLVSATGQG
ncbi:MAG TPA: S8 family serine peptidase [Sphingomicrobium sp.]